MLVPYTSLPLKERIRAYAASHDGFFAEYEENGTVSWAIFYNDTMMPERIRFTILHEIGHIMLTLIIHLHRKTHPARSEAEYKRTPHAHVLRRPWTS